MAVYFLSTQWDPFGFFLDKPFPFVYGVIQFSL
jgi:hypothetical protein